MKILFLCVANSARSQLAEGLAKSIFGEKIHVESAGSTPSGIVQPMAIRVLKEEGIDICQSWSKSFEELNPIFLKELDYVITLCAEEVCPAIITKAKRLHWPISDPAVESDEKKLEAFRSARDEIKKRLKELSHTIKQVLEQ